MKSNTKKNRTNKIKTCCASNSKSRKCIRKSDKKIFSLPRRFNKQTCISKPIKGFTMKASCAPYKGCSRKKHKKFKGGRKILNKNNTAKRIKKEELPRGQRRVPEGLNVFNNENDGGPMMVTMNTPITPPRNQQPQFITHTANNFVPDTPIRRRIQQQANRNNIQYRDLLNNLLRTGQLDRPPARIERVPGLTRMIREQSIENLAEDVRSGRLPIVNVSMSDISEPPTPETPVTQSNIVIDTLSNVNSTPTRRRRSRPSTPTTPTRRTRRRRR